MKKKEADLRKKIEVEKNKNKPKSIIDEIQDYGDVLRLNTISDESKDVISIDKFDEYEHNFLRNFVRKMRICKAYGQGKRFTKNDIRYYNWV